jgi:amino acid transporter
MCASRGKFLVVAKCTSGGHGYPQAMQRSRSAGTRGVALVRWWFEAAFSVIFLAIFILCAVAAIIDWPENKGTIILMLAISLLLLLFTFRGAVKARRRLVRLSRYDNPEPPDMG